MIALIINFQYIFCLKKSRWAATKKQMISVPVASDKVTHTLQQLPRLPNEAGFVEVGVKRKMEYKQSHRIELINPDKIFKVLEYIKKCGHPYYQDFDDYLTYEKRCRDLDEQGHQMLFGTEEDGNIESDGAIEHDEIEEVEQDEMNKDTIRKH